jgi:hypothetical protein
VHVRISLRTIVIPQLQLQLLFFTPNRCRCSRCTRGTGEKELAVGAIADDTAAVHALSTSHLRILVIIWVKNSEIAITECEVVSCRAARTQLQLLPGNGGTQLDAVLRAGASRR